MNKENFKRIMSEKKTRLPSVKNQDQRTVTAETEKINELLTHMLTNNITELNELINAGAKLTCEKKIGVSQKTRTETQNMNRKFDWKHR